jgi:hypothetical protein
MAEDGIPEILAEQRLGHQVPGMRGLYAHASTRMRDDLKQALQTRWEESLRARAALSPHSPVPLVDGLLAPFRASDCQPGEPMTPRVTERQARTRMGREKMISQIPPKQPESPTPALRGEPVLTPLNWSDIKNWGVELGGLEPPTPCLQSTCSSS